MSISSALSSALSGLTANSRMAEVAASNVSNALTEGYARREVSLSSRVIGMTGVGVTINGVTRHVNRGLLQDLRLSNASLGSRDTTKDFLLQFEKTLGTPDQASSLSGRIAALEKSLIEAAARPESEARLAAVGDRLRDPATPDLATHDDIERLHEHAARVLANAGFYDPANPKRLLPRLRRMVAKARLEREEVQILRGMLKLAEDGPHPGTVAGRNTPGTSRGNG